MKNGLFNLPEEFYELAQELADDLMPVIQEEINDLADEYDIPTALGIGGAAMVYLIVGLGNTYDDQMDMPPDMTASEALAVSVVDALNKRIQHSVSKANGELN